MRDKLPGRRIAVLVFFVASLGMDVSAGETWATDITPTPTPTALIVDHPTPTTPTATPCPLLGSVFFNGFSAQPEHPVVGDEVTLTFQVATFVYSLSGFALAGADPYLTGDEESVRSGDTVTFVRTAASAGTANLRLIVNYVGERQCDGIFIPENASAVSPPYPLVIDAPSPTPTPAPVISIAPGK